MSVTSKRTSTNRRPSRPAPVRPSPITLEPLPSCIFASRLIGIKARASRPVYFFLGIARDDRTTGPCGGYRRRLRRDGGRLGTIKAARLRDPRLREELVPGR